MTTASKSEGRVLLPPNVEPTKYKITLEPDLVKFTYDGDEDIEVDVVSETSTVILHTKELNVSVASFKAEGGAAAIGATSLSYELKLTTLTITFESALPVGKGTLSLKFVGCLNGEMAGFYRSHYTSIGGEKRVMASTQFEAIDARRCFPCWDEPHRKAVFEVTLVVSSNLVAFSNMPESSSGMLASGKTSISFQPTPRMSTYLLAFCVGEFDFLQSTTEGGVAIRVNTPPGKKQMGRFALDVAVKTLDMYDKFFKLPYPLPKLDMVAIPEFAMGAMENWGLVTYREVYILVDEKKASSSDLQRVCSVIAHELAHQWFGNLVTMRWWDDLWLNEGFASWTAVYASHELFPSWGMWEQYVTDDQASALRLDSLRTSHPIQVPIAHAEEVEQVFDAISYCKGSAVVRMLYAVLGPDLFQKGLQVYMDRHKYGNTETIHLWTAWAEVSGMPIAEIMASWTEQMGHPVVSVVEEKWSATSVTLTLEQNWFLADGSVEAGDKDKTWIVPLLCASGGGGTTKVELMKEKRHTIEVKISGEDDWVKLNAGQHTLMRVQYTPKMLQALTKAIQSKALIAEDRAGLISDAYALSKAGKMDAGELVKLLPAYVNEDNSTVWEALEGVLVGLDKVLVEEEEIHSAFAAMAAKLIAPAAAAIGWEKRPTDGHLDGLLRGTMIRLLGRFAWRTPEVQSEARRRFDGHVADPTDPTVLPREISTPVFQVVLKAGGAAEYDAVLGLISRYEDHTEKLKVFQAIGYAPAPALKNKAMEWAVNTLKLQDFFYPIASVSSSDKVGLNLAWEFFKNNFERLKALIGNASPSLMDATIAYSCGGFCDAARANEVEKFFKEHPMPKNERKISQLLESMRINAGFVLQIKASAVAKPEFWKSLPL